MIETFFPQDRVARTLTVSTMAFALSSGVFYAVSTLYFTLVIGLSVTTVGLGLGIAGGAGVLASYAGGWLADRVAAHHVQTVATGLYGLSLLAYTFVTDAVAFTLIACVAVITRSVGSSSKQAMLARWYQGPDRVAVRARMRVVTNVFIGLGTTAAAAALLIGTAPAYRTAIVVAGVLLLAATVPLAGLGRRVPELAAAMTAVRAERTASTGPSPLRDRTYLASVVCNAVVAMQFGLLTVGMPLWVATTDAPTAIVSVLLVLNTAVVAALQVRASRGTDDVRTAGLTVRRASWLLALACGLYALAGYATVIVACALFVVAAFTHTMGEILGEAGGWGMSFELADPRSAGAYQGLSQTGYAIAGMFSPVLATTAVELGTVGWAGLAALFVLAGTGAAAVARRAAPLVPVGQSY
ncbi:MFS transporter [Nonomuraea sp. NN258]|uniref:MFS transporter n=1 Tax=Nonomuraea antri TaxID=2730852 RepID=UPI001569F13C|nr:MFS transporter [Nonomuraea antri]NRQ31211.1 MFS transporter [Nonomuraea antri]